MKILIFTKKGYVRKMDTNRDMKSLGKKCQIQLEEGDEIVTAINIGTPYE